MPRGALPIGPSYTFVGPSGRARADELEAFAVACLERLRIGHAEGAAFEVRWSTGPDGGVAVLPRNPSGGRWWRTVGLPGYPPTSWRSVAGSARRGPVAWIGEPAGASDGPFRSGACPPWADHLARTFRSGPRGWTLVWSLEAAGRWDVVRRPPVPVLRRIPGWSTTAPPPPPLAERDRDDRLSLRRIEPRWAAALWLEGGPTPGEGSYVARAVEGAGRQDDGAGPRFRPRTFWHASCRPRFLLSTAEVAGLLPTPWSPWRSDEAGPTGRARGLTLGRDPAGFPLVVPIEPGNGRHLLVTGETGMGKSSFLVDLALSARTMGAVLVLDPLGDTGRSLLAALPPAERARAVWISPAGAPVGANALAGARGPGLAAERTRGDLVDALRRVRSSRFAAGPFWGPRVEEVTAWALDAAAACPRGTLLDAERFLQDPERDPPEGAGPEVGERLQWLRRRARTRPEELDGARRVLSEAIRSASVRRLLADAGAGPPLARAFERGRLTVITADAGAIGEAAARALLSLYLALAWSALVGRTDPTPVFLLLDEASWYANDALAAMVRLGRRWGLHVVAATQSMAAYPEEIREALLTNAADQVRFRGPVPDARELERALPGVDVGQVASLPRGMALVLLGRGRETRWLAVRPRPPGAGMVRGRGPTPPDPAPTEPAEDPEAPVRAALRALAAVPADGSPVVLELSDWRRRHGLDASAVRRLGRELASAGVVRTERGPRGTRWIVAVDRLRAWTGPGAPAPADGGSGTAPPHGEGF